MRVEVADVAYTAEPVGTNGWFRLWAHGEDRTPPRYPNARGAYRPMLVVGPKYAKTHRL